MKKLLLIATVLAAGVLMSACGEASKKISSNSGNPTPTLTSTYSTYDIEQGKQQSRQSVKDEQYFCMEEALDKPGEYMGGLGVVEGCPDRTRAITDANRAAIADISTRYIGIIKNAIEDYSKDVNVPSGNKIYESSLEGGVAAIGKKIIDKYANVVCRKLLQESTGGWVGYVAVRVMLQDVQKGIADEFEVIKADYDKVKFFEKMDAEFDKDAAKQPKKLEGMADELNK